MALAFDFVRWYVARLASAKKLSWEYITERVLALSDWLRQRDYIGYDVRVGNPPRTMSTVLGSCLMGWINLYRLSSEDRYLREGEQCLERILAMQRPEGSWLFPYRFRSNPADFPYACENFMTLRALFHYMDHIGTDERVVRSVRLALDFLVDSIGYEGGVFWYSSADKIRVPNISSMASNAFARATLLFDEDRYLKQARVFAEYCVESQGSNGAYPYYVDDPMVYIPYHALETWELQEANEVIHSDEILASTSRARDYLDSYLRLHGYASYNTDIGRRQRQLFKTPLWIAKAFLAKEDYVRALEHFARALTIFRVPGKAYYFYILYRICLAGLIVECPILPSAFIRYNASCFEIGSSLILHRKEAE